ncbi:MAG: hypothetical protein JWP06_436 [Candidatus Saccharibacteria bacterium]|nr:hypothetical protein [Candidatus Saccharibacteria bacterium]
MYSLRRAIAGTAVVVLLLTACSRGGGEQPDASSTAASSPLVTSSSTTAAVRPTPVPFFTGKVSLTDLPDCAKVRCWLPTQFTTKLVNDVSVSRQGIWPMEGDAVRVLCQTVGGSYQNPAGQTVSNWYGILVPTDKLEPGADKQATKVTGGYLGYVGISWLTGGEGKLAPDCKTLVK